jgi:hypothetical protein
MKAKNYFKFYSVYGDFLRDLPAEQVKSLVVAACEYQFEGVIPKFAGDDAALFNMWKTYLDAEGVKKHG